MYDQTRPQYSWKTRCNHPWPRARSWAEIGKSACLRPGIQSKPLASSLLFPFPVHLEDVRPPCCDRYMGSRQSLSGRSRTSRSAAKDEPVAGTVCTVGSPVDEAFGRFGNNALICGSGFVENFPGSVIFVLADCCCPFGLPNPVMPIF